MRKLARVLSVVSPVGLVASLPLLIGASRPAAATAMCHDIIVTPNGSGSIRLDLTMGSSVQVPSVYGNRVAVTAARPTDVWVSPASQEEIEVVGGGAVQTVAHTKGRRGSASARLEPGMKFVLSPRNGRSMTVTTTDAATIVLGHEPVVTGAPGIVAAPAQRPADPANPY